MLPLTRNIERILTLLLVAFAITACGGGGGGSDNDSDTSNDSGGQPSTVISGVVQDDPVASATVVISGLGGATIATIQTDSQGAYRATVPEASIEDGYTLRATGGDINGKPFEGELRAIYSAQDDPQDANATLLTTLISRLAEQKTTGSLVDKRDTVIQRLAAE